MDACDQMEKHFYKSLEAAGHRLEDMRTEVSLQRMFRAYTGRPWESEEVLPKSPSANDVQDARATWTHPLYEGFRLIGSRETEDAVALSRPSCSGVNRVRMSSPAPHVLRYRRSR